jgi:hypothetical protein
MNPIWKRELSIQWGIALFLRHFRSRTVPTGQRAVACCVWSPDIPGTYTSPVAWTQFPSFWVGRAAAYRSSRHRRVCRKLKLTRGTGNGVATWVVSGRFLFEAALFSTCGRPIEGSSVFRVELHNTAPGSLEPCSNVDLKVSDKNANRLWNTVSCC